MSEVYADSIQAKVNGTAQAVPIRDITKAPAIAESTSGESIQLSDSGDAPLTDIKLYGKSKQDGEPSPDNPVEIEIPGSEGNVGIESVGANLLDADNAKVGMINNNGKVDTSNSWWRCIEYIQIDSEKQYVISQKESASDVYFQFLNAFYDSDKTLIGSVASIVSDSNNNALLTAPANARYLSVSWSVRINQVSVNRTIMLNKGSTPLPYEPYKHTSAILPTPNGLPGIPVESGGNYTDADGQQWVCDEIDYARGKYVQRVNYVTIDENTNITTQVINDNLRFGARITENQTFYSGKYFNEKYGKCNRLEVSPKPLVDNSLNNAITCYSRGGVFFRMDQFNDVTSLKAWLTSNPIKYMYVLASPIETDLSTEQLTALKQPRTYQTVTNITTDSEPQVGMEVEYTADTKTYIDNKFAELAQSLAATQNTLLQEV